jgi:hypothetical protein
LAVTRPKRLQRPKTPTNTTGQAEFKGRKKTVMRVFFLKSSPVRSSLRSGPHAASGFTLDFRKPAPWYPTARALQSGRITTKKGEIMQKQSQPQTTNNPKERDASVQIREGRHTPGPWKSKYVGSGFEITSDKGGYIADIFCVARNHTNMEDDAQLIAAAPELLAELEAAEQIILAMLNVMTQEQKTAADEKLTLAGVSTGGMTRYHERRAVIAKAHGQ